MNKMSIVPALGFLLLLSAAPASAKDGERAIVAKSGETVDVREVYGASHCKSILLAPPEVEVLKGPPELKLSVREDMVQPRNCREPLREDRPGTARRLCPPAGFRRRVRPGRLGWRS